MEPTYKHSYKLAPQMSSLYVQNTGRQRCSPGYSWGPGIRDHYLVHHVLAGRGTLEVGGQRYLLGPGDTFLTFPNTTIHYFADDDDPWEYIWVGFAGVDARQLVEQTDFSSQTPVAEQFYPQEIARLLTELYDDYGTAPWSRVAITGRLYLLLSFLICHSGKAGTKGPVPRQDCAQAAASYMMSHYERPLTVEELAEFMAVSQSSLYRSFRERYGRSPKRFLLEYRVQRACELLHRGGLSVREIAYSVGFEDPLYFSRVFRQLKGCSPRQYAAAEDEETEEK